MFEENDIFKCTVFIHDDITEDHHQIDTVLNNVVENRTALILKLIAENSKISARQMTKALNKTSRTIQRDLDHLTKTKKIEHVGPAKSGYWQVFDQEKQD